MERYLLDKKHLLLTSANDIQQICAPLKKLEITSFHFLKNFPDKTQIKLSETPDWQKYLFSYGLHNISPFVKPPQQYCSGCYLWSSLDKPEFFEAAEAFNIAHGLTLIVKMSDGTSEFYCFGGERKNPGITNILLNNIELLQRFGLYFREKASSLIRTSIKYYRIPCPTAPIVEEFKKQDPAMSLVADPYVKRNFLRDIRITEYYLNIANETIVMSGRELDCLLYALQNQTAQAIADKLFLSRRTVEKHLENIKSKLQCTSKEDLKEKLMPYIHELYLSY